MAIVIGMALQDPAKLTNKILFAGAKEFLALESLRFWMMIGVCIFGNPGCAAL
jgi:hypothetical protein